MTCCRCSKVALYVVGKTYACKLHRPVLVALCRKATAAREAYGTEFEASMRNRAVRERMINNMKHRRHP